MVNTLATLVSKVARLVSVAGDRGQFRWQSWLDAVAKVVNWLAFCSC